MIIPSNTFCSMAWDHQFIDPTGRVKPCCRFDDPVRRTLADNTLSGIFYGPNMNEVRRKMLAGEQVDGCIRCYQEEDAGKKSLRERYHSNQDLPINELVDLDHPKIKWVELAISNDCNLACRMCDSRYSWKWFKEEQAIFGKTRNEVEHSKSDIANIFPFIDELVHIKFTGGEPLMTPDHWVLIDKLINERDCREIFLNYSTNCTIEPKDAWLEKWSKFKKVEFAVSFDSSNKAESEYIRWPSKYETTERVAERFLSVKKSHGFSVMLRTTVSVLNIWHLPETMKWWHDRDSGHISMNPTHLTFPPELSITVLPAETKAAITDRFNAFKSTCDITAINKNIDYLLAYMNGKDDSQLLPVLYKYVTSTDGYRNQSFIASYPHFATIFDQNNDKSPYEETSSIKTQVPRSQADGYHVVHWKKV